MRLQVFSEGNYPRCMEKLEEHLQRIAEKGYFTAADGLSLYYEHFPNQEAKTCLLLVHGFTEFSEKYHELAGYLRQAGYEIFLCDLRGHGLSDRQVEPPSLTHVDSYEDYVSDLEACLEQVVRPAAGDRPIYLFGHSMGAAIVTLYLQKHPTEIPKAILSSPMITPVTPLPLWFLSAYTKREGKKHGFTARFPHTKDFDPNPVFEKSSDTSRSRFEHHIALRRAEPRYQNAASTHGWMHRTLNIRKELLCRTALRPIETQILLTQAGKDTVVRLKPQNQLAERLPKCKKVVFPNAKHTLFYADSQTVETYLVCVLDFLAG